VADVLECGAGFLDPETLEAQVQQFVDRILARRSAKSTTIRSGLCSWAMAVSWLMGPITWPPSSPVPAGISSRTY